MQKKLSKNTGIEFNTFEFVVIFWENKLLLLLILVISILLGFGFIFLFGNVNKFNTTKSTIINILIEETPHFQTDIVVADLNKKILSSYTFEKWSKENMDLSNRLNISLQLIQNTIQALKITQNSHTIDISSFSNQDAVVSYIAFTVKLISDKIMNEIKFSKNLLRETYENEKNKISEKYKMKIIDIENEIFNLAVEKKAAEEELDFIRANVLKQSKDTTQSTFDSVLREFHILDLTNKIKVNTLIIENQKIRISSYMDLENESHKELLKLDGELKKLENEINQAEGHDLIKLGNIRTNIIQPSRPNNLLIILVSIITGLILAVFVVLFKIEYIKQKKI